MSTPQRSSIRGDLSPVEVDETTSMELRVLVADVSLKGSPSGSAKCENCEYYLEPTAELSYCWHPALRILVGAEWWCECWEAPAAEG